MESNSYQALGLMSGTSLDGLDLCLARFRESDSGKWSFEIVASQTIAYPSAWQNALATASGLSPLNFWALHKRYGGFLGKKAADFLSAARQTADCIASHGHTIFHTPEKGITCQIGDGASIAATAGVDCVCDFRSTDVALGGQGAPLVPIGDELLFSQYDFCLNIGGFANISLPAQDGRIAYDICPANGVANFLMQQHTNQEFDKNGETGRAGKISQALLNALNSLAFYHIAPPKSLGWEWNEAYLLPLLHNSGLSPEDKLRTFYEHVAYQIARSLPAGKPRKLLITGGGAYNQFLIERLAAHTAHQLCLPQPEIIDFKEALVFAFLGTLRLAKRANCLVAATGAEKKHSAGAIYLAPKF